MIQNSNKKWVVIYMTIFKDLKSLFGYITYILVGKNPSVLKITNILFDSKKCSAVIDNKSILLKIIYSR